MPVWIQRFPLNSVLRFSFFSFSLTSRAFQETTSTVASLFITIHVLKNIKNVSCDTIHTFKNYFATVFSVFSFSNNKFSPNGSIVCVWIRIISSCVCVFWLFFFWVPATLFDQVNCEQCTHALFMDPKTLFFSNFFIKNEFHDTIHTFKNYFVTVFLVSTKISSNDRIQDI